MMYKERLCPFVFHADFECFCVKEDRHKEDGEDDTINASNTASSSHETPPRLKTKSKQTTRKHESNHEPNSHSINIEVREDYIDIVNKKTTLNYFIYIETKMNMQLNHLYTR